MSEKAGSAQAWTAVLLLPLIFVWSGYVFTVLWAWFIVPAFQLPALNIAQAIGIATLINFLTYPIGLKTNDDTVIERLLEAAFRPLIALAVGYVAKGFL